MRLIATNGITGDVASFVGMREAKEAPNGEAARHRAASVATAAGNVGAVAFQEGVVLASVGEVDLDALQG